MLARRNPWQALSQVEREMDELFRRTFGHDIVTPLAQGTSTRGRAEAWTPAIDVLSREGDLVVRAELPGIDPDRDVQIFVQDGVLYLTGERRHQEETEGEGFLRRESSFGAFERAVRLPQDVRDEDISATYERGVLEVIVPKAVRTAKARHIKVTTSGPELAPSGRAAASDQDANGHVGEPELASAGRES